MRRVSAITFLVGNTIGNLEQIHVTIWHPDEFGLASSEASSQVGIAEYTCSPAAEEYVLNGVGVGPLALRGELFLAIEALREMLGTQAI